MYDDGNGVLKPQPLQQERMRERANEWRWMMVEARCSAGTFPPSAEAAPQRASSTWSVPALTELGSSASPLAASAALRTDRGLSSPYCCMVKCVCKLIVRLVIGLGCGTIDQCPVSLPVQIAWLHYLPGRRGYLSRIISLFQHQL